MICPECGQDFPGEPILLRHREFEHPEEFAAAGSADAEAARALQEAAAEEGRYTSDGFLKRVGAKREAPPTDNAGLLDGLFPSADPGAALPPWDRELQDRRGP